MWLSLEISTLILLLSFITEERAVQIENKKQNNTCQHDTSVSEERLTEVDQHGTSVFDDTFALLESEIPPPPDEMSTIVSLLSLSKHTTRTMLVPKDIGQNDTDVSKDAFALRSEMSPPDQLAAIVKEAVPTEPMKLTKKALPFCMFLKLKAKRGACFLKQIAMEWYGIRISLGS